VFNTNNPLFIDISVHNRNIKSIQEEKDLTQHSLAYLNYLEAPIRATVIRFGSNYEITDNFRLYRHHPIDLLKFYFYIKEKKEAVILFHGFSFPFRFLFLSMLLSKQVKWIIQHHAGNPSNNKLKKFIQKLSYSRAHAYLFVTKQQAEPFITDGLIKSNNQVFEIMECSTPFKKQDKIKCRQTLGLKSDQLIFIWVGGLDANKDPICMLKALQLLKESGSYFLLFMFYNKTDLLHEVELFINENKLTEHVILKGIIANNYLENWFSAADFYISCSHSEGSGIALAEALACGCIPIVSNIPSFKYMTNNGAVGKLFNCGDHFDLHEQLNAIKNINMINEQSKAIELFQSKLSAEAIGKKTSALINKLNDSMVKK
jgi:glycosyltransferase involved in cell wall biosynthesis